MTLLLVNSDLANLTRFEQAVAVFGQNKPRQWASWAMNQVGGKMRTQIIRSLVQQTGLKYGEVLGQITTEKASDWVLRYALTGAGRYFGLGHFSPHAAGYTPRGGMGPRTEGGVTASPWNRTRFFRKTFVIGHEVYRRVGPGPRDLDVLYGSAVPREMERDAVPQDFIEAAEKELPAAIDRKLAQMMPW